MKLKPPTSVSKCLPRSKFDSDVRVFFIQGFNGVKELRDQDPPERRSRTSGLTQN